VRKEGDTLSLIETPGPEIKGQYRMGHEVIIIPAPPLLGVEPEPIKSAKESSETFLAHGFVSMEGNDAEDDEADALKDKICNEVDKLAGGWCKHMCSLWEGHSGTHECEFCQQDFGVSRIPCSYRWENNSGCTMHVCENMWGHSISAPHDCESCKESAPGEWGQA